MRNGRIRPIRGNLVLSYVVLGFECLVDEQIGMNVFEGKCLEKSRVRSDNSAKTAV